MAEDNQAVNEGAENTEPAPTPHEEVQELTVRVRDMVKALEAHEEHLTANVIRREALQLKPFITQLQGIGNELESLSEKMAPAPTEVVTNVVPSSGKQTQVLTETNDDSQNEDSPAP